MKKTGILCLCLALLLCFSAPANIAAAAYEGDSTQTYIAGDIDGDNRVATEDVVALLLFISMPDMFPVAAEIQTDFNGDSLCNTDDAVRLLLFISMPDLFPLPVGPGEPSVSDTYTTAPVIGQAYKLRIDQKRINKILYLTGEMDSYYYGSTEKAAEAVDVYFEEADGGYRVYFWKNNAKNYLEIVKNGAYTNVVFTTTPTKVLQWNTEIASVICDVEGTAHYFGTYRSYTTFSASSISYVTGNNAADFDVSSFVAHFYEVGVEIPPEPTEPIPTEPPPVTEPGEPCTHSDVGNDGFCDWCNEMVLVLVDFYGINDLHGKIADTEANPGVDELSTYLENARETDDHAIFVSAGDMWQGSPESNLTQGLLTTDWMNELGFAAMALGNHEFDWGEEPIAENEKLAEFPLLAINVYNATTNQQAEYCESSLLVDLGEVQIGIVGAIGDCYSSIAPDQVQNVYFKTGAELTALVKNESDKLRNEGADFVVYLLHDGYGSSKSQEGASISSSQLKSYYDVSLSDGYIDLVFEGHSHQAYALVDQYGVYHMQSGGDNQNGVSHVEVVVNLANGKCTTRVAELVEHNEYTHLEDSPVISELLEKYKDQIAQGTVVLGTNRTDRGDDAVLQIVADLYYEKGVELWGDQYDIVLGGGYLSMRSPYYLAKGDVTYGMLYSILPFDNELVLCSIKGSDLKRRFFETSNNSYFIGYGAYGESVRDNLNANATYYIVVDSYSASYGPNRLTEIARYNEKVYARDLLAEYIKAGGLE